tara:strand:- start:11779 stop:12120 length:342 start_codon:yes stop_codon:yes gene_type:complete
MRKILTIAFFLLPFFIFSQNATKWQVNQAEKISNYVVEKLNLSTEDASFFKEVQLAQIVENATKIKESGATTQEEKRVIYREGYNNLKSKLTEKFGKKIAQEILSASNEARNN